MKNWRIIFLFSLLLGFLFISPKGIFAQAPPLDFPETGLGVTVKKDSVVTLAPDLYNQHIFVKSFSAEQVANWYKLEAEKAGWQISQKGKEYRFSQRFSKGELFFDVEVIGGLKVSEDPSGRREDDTDINLEWGSKESLKKFYDVLPLLYPKAEPVGETEEIKEPFLGQQRKFKTKMSMGNVTEWYREKLIKIGWQSEGEIIKGDKREWGESFSRDQERLAVFTSNFMEDPTVYTLQWTKREKEEEKTEEKSLKEIMNNYYYFRHLANQRMGWHFWDWALSAVFPKQMETLKETKKGPFDRLVNFLGLGNIKEKWNESIKLITNLSEMIARKDTKAAKCLLGSYAAEKAEIIGSASALVFGGLYTDCMIDRAKEYYQKTLEKLKSEDPSYCVFQEIWEGKNYCYKSWFEYWKEFRPKGAFSMLTSVPRGLEEYNKAATRWQEKTKFGEFSDGTKYTVKEITGEDWQDAFEDMNWTTQRYEIPLFKPKEKIETTPTSPPPTQESPTITTKQEWPPVYPGAWKVGKEYTQENTGERCQVYFIKAIKGNDVYRWYCDKLKELGWKITFDDQVTSFEKDNETFAYEYVGQSQVNKTYWERILLPKIEGLKPTTNDEEGFILCWSQGESTKPTSIAESGKIITVSEFEKLPKGCFKKPPETYLMIAKVEEDWGEAFTGNNYKVSDQTGTTTVSTHQRKLELGKTYQFKGCKGGICASPDTPCWYVFEVWDDEWPEAIIEK